MKLTKSIIEKIKEWEGWRANAYKDAVGVWTIGYGHTTMAGPPAVSHGLTITKEQGEEILLRDLKKYEKAVRDAVTVPLNDNQYSALVSFTYNVGPGNLRKSSALRCVNSGDFDSVPQKLMLYNKGRINGKLTVLRGLTRRRGFEGEIFATPVTDKPYDEPVVRKEDIEVEPGKPKMRSTTIWAAIGSLLSTFFTALASLANSSPMVATVLIVMVFLSLGFTGWIVRERIKKMIEEGI